MAIKVVIELSSRNFVIRPRCNDSYAVVKMHVKTMQEWGMIKEGRRLVYRPTKMYAAKSLDGFSIRLHINLFNKVMNDLRNRGIKEHEIEIIQPRKYEVTKVDLDIFPQWSDREHQKPIIKYGLSKDVPHGLVDLQTGKGKSYCAMRIASELGVLTAFIFKPMYIEKWLIDIRKTYDLDIKKDVYIVKGSDSLIKLLRLKAEGLLDVKIIIFSNKTLQMWYKMFEAIGDAILDMGYETTPDRLFEFLGVGLRITDEVHQDYHLNFKIDLYSHVERTLALSATLINANQFLLDMYHLGYPVDERYVDNNYSKYISCISYRYQVKNIRKLRINYPGNNTYSHAAYEESLIKHRDILDNYFKMIRHITDREFISRYKDGNKLMVFCSTKEFCTLLVNYLRTHYKQFVIERYVEGDPKENLYDPDIRVSTMQSAGTAVDIDKLHTVIMTIAVSSEQSNVQGVGRLREMKDGQTPYFIWLSCKDIPQHMRYDNAKQELLANRVLKIDTRWYGQML